MCFVYFFKIEQKYLATEKLKIPSESLDNFASYVDKKTKLSSKIKQKYTKGQDNAK